MAERQLFRGQLVRLALPRPEDARQFAEWSEDSEYSRNLDSDYARLFTEEEMSQRHGPGSSGPNSFLFHLRTTEGDRLIGFVALFNIEWNNRTAVMAIGIGDAAYRGMGYGREALYLLLNYAFNELNLFRVGLDVIADNEPAVLSYARAGFKEEGRMRLAVERDGKRVDRIYMGILREEWEAAQKAPNYVYSDAVL